ncbi:MAG TPA: hypothetical protein VM843_04640 [Flavisolibacter sp.]|jgi:Tfp pilus assembly protein PilF|nr:hypothetical protein [Flavisolibacter sp.]
MERIERLGEFLKATPRDCFVKHALALEYIKQGKDGLAEIQFRELLAIDENYIGSYYHLAKLLERSGTVEEAVEVYQKGMEKAKAAGDRHAYSELQSAWEDLTF